MKYGSLAVAFAFSFSLSAFAQDNQASEGETKIKLEDASGNKNKVSGDIDQEITNARMRAESGSKSKWSLSASMAYTGGTFSRPFATERPDLASEPGNQDVTSLDAGIDVRYRWSKSDSLTLGTSMGLNTPFQGDVDADNNQLTIYDPSIAYNRVGKIGALQTQGSIAVSAGTSQWSQSIDRVASYGLSYTFLHGFENGWTTGLSFGLGLNQYDNGAGKNTRYAKAGYYGGDKRSDYSLGIYPFAEYAFNDTYSFRTVFGYFNWKHLYGDSHTTRLLQQYVYQSVGVGLSVTRDIYLYPNVQFVPDNIRSDFTNVALSATLNVF
jgi:hypothetical protein